jgi:lysophospholipase L1-like esterase
MRALGAELGVEVHDLHAHLGSDEIRDAGFLWWDFVHATSLGQLEIADWLAPRLEPVVARLCGR